MRLAIPTHRPRFFASCTWLLTTVAITLISQSLVAHSQEAIASGATLHEPLLPRQLVTFEVVLGRLQLSSESFRIGSAHERIPVDETSELTVYRLRSIAVSVARGKPTLQLQDVGGEEDWKVQFKAGHHAEIRFEPHNDSQLSRWSYRQPVQGPIVIEVEFKDNKPLRRVESPSLWHLLISDPKFFADYVEPVLTKVEPNWDFQRTGREVRQLLDEQAETGSQTSPASAISSAVAKLDSRSVVTRTAGSLEIERLGLAAKVHLQSALTGSISNQQRSAVNRLLEVLQPTGNDSAMRVAVWLSGDREVQLASQSDARLLR